MISLVCDGVRLIPFWVFFAFVRHFSFVLIKWDLDLLIFQRRYLENGFKKVWGSP